MANGISADNLNILFNNALSDGISQKLASDMADLLSAKQSLFGSYLGATVLSTGVTPNIVGATVGTLQIGTPTTAVPPSMPSPEQMVPKPWSQPSILEDQSN